jgi:hypothetical protein
MNLRTPEMYTLCAIETNLPILSGNNIIYPSTYGVYVTYACGGGCSGGSNKKPNGAAEIVVEMEVAVLKEKLKKSLFT